MSIKMIKVLEKKDGIVLEGELFIPEKSSLKPYMTVLCHPHPQFGGSMNNNVVNALFRGFQGENIPVLRFNFRGVGRSTGSYSGKGGEIRDVLAAVGDFRTCFPKISNIIVAGYSYGAAMGGVAAAKEDDVVAFIAVAFPFDLFPEEAKLSNSTKPKFFLQGTQDSVANAKTFEAHFDALSPPKEKCWVDGADHFFGGCERELTENVLQYLRNL